MAGRPLRQTRSHTARSLPDLVKLLGAPPGLPVLPWEVKNAYDGGVITKDEFVVLDRHARLEPRAQKRALRLARTVTTADIAKMREKLQSLNRKIERSPQLGEATDET